MSEKQYLKALNKEIQKLNGEIDNKIIHHTNYRREARRHKELLKKLRRENQNRSLLSFLTLGMFGTLRMR